MESQRGGHDWAAELNWIVLTFGVTLINVLLIIRMRLLELISFNSFLLMRNWRRAWQPTPVFLPGESHGQRSLAAYSPCGCKALDTTEHTSTELYQKTSEVIRSLSPHWELPGCSSYKSRRIPGHCVSNSNTQNSGAIGDKLFQNGEQVLRKFLPKPTLIFCWLSR